MAEPRAEPVRFAGVRGRLARTARAAVRPVWDGEVFRPQTLLPLALSYDHRVVNGGDGGRFLTELTSLLSDVKRMVM